MDVEKVFFVVFFTLVMPAAWVLLVPLARRIRQGTQPSAPSPEVLAELEHLNARIAELEERLDFAERMLASHREPERLERERP
jgi:hypothetical protein